MSIPRYELSIASSESILAGAGFSTYGFLSGCGGLKKTGVVRPKRLISG